MSSKELKDWIEQQKITLRDSPEETKLLRGIDDSYDRYLSTAASAVEAFLKTPPGTNALETIDQITTNCITILDLGYDLEAAHGKLLEDSLGASREAVGALERVILGALVLLFLFGLWLGITVYREMIAPLRVKLVEAQALVERHEKLASLGTLAAGVAHEIRNPLTAIKARLFTQQKKLKTGTPEHEDALVIGQEINRLERIVRDFLLFARPSEPKLAEMPAGEPLREVQALLAPQLQKNDIQILVEGGGEELIRADLPQIKQVLINLVQNAADSIGHHGSIRLRARRDTVRLSDRLTEVVILEVADTGKGIPPEVQKRLFDPFFSTKEGGTGLGLSIAARIVEKHGGALQYQTRPNHGTTFGLVLPCTPSVTQAARPAAPPASRPTDSHEDHRQNPAH